jgi:hypothetical protein
MKFTGQVSTPHNRIMKKFQNFTFKRKKERKKENRLFQKEHLLFTFQCLSSPWCWWSGGWISIRLAEDFPFF